jgi:predicted N-acetyltransferase YhbS
VRDVATLDIRLATPDDARELAATTRLGFESYLEWAPEGWRPPPRSLELRAIRERLKQNTTWCAMALDEDGEQAGHVGITHAAERDRPHVRIPGRAHLWMLFVRPQWWGSGLAVRLHRLALEEAGRRL